MVTRITPSSFPAKPEVETVFCHGDEENGRRACTSIHLTTADQSGMRNTYRLCHGDEENKRCVCMN